MSVAGSGSVRREKSSTAANEESSPTSSMEAVLDFLVSPRCYQLYASALKVRQTPVPSDWRKQLEMEMENLPDDVMVQDLVKAIAALSPDRARTVIQVIEEEVSVMEDVVDHFALERVKRLRREFQAELKVLSGAARAARAAALESNRRLLRLFPNFNWDRYHCDPAYLQRLVCDRDNAERLVKEEKVEDTIAQNEAEKKYLLAEIKELREQRVILQQRLQEGCELDADEEIVKAQRKNDLLRAHYEHLCELVEEQGSKRKDNSPCVC